MNIRSIFVALPIGLAASACAIAHAAPLATIKSCNLGGRKIALVATPITTEGQTIYLKVGSKIQSAFFDMDSAALTGRILTAQCLRHEFIYTYNYGPPYIKGVLLRTGQANRSLEHLDFAEKASPQWLYSNKDEMRLVIPNESNEISGNYLIYRYPQADASSDNPIGSNNLPGSDGFDVQKIGSPKDENHR